MNWIQRDPLLRCNDWRPDSRRRERSASITFDLEEERRGRMEEEERRSELRRRNSKKEKRTAVKEDKATRTTRRAESPERGLGRSKSVGSIAVKQEEEQDAGSLSMWSCRRYGEISFAMKILPPFQVHTGKPTARDNLPCLRRKQTLLNWRH